jgi:hypothetical protein
VCAPTLVLLVYCARSMRDRMDLDGSSSFFACSALVACDQGLTLVHFSAQLEPCLTQENTQNILDTPQHPLKTGYTTPTRNPYPIQSAQVELISGRV